MSRCALCPGVNACIPPDGPQIKGGLLFIGEAPGKDENRRALQQPPGKPFIGKTGDEVNRHYLPLAGLSRAATTFTNAIRCLPTSAGGKLDPGRSQDVALLECCANKNLYPLIEQMQPQLIVPLGGFACRAVFGESYDLELLHGLPAQSPFGPAFPMYHPALGIHEPKKMLYIRTDWQRLRSYLSGTLPERQDLWAGGEDYQEVTDESQFGELDLSLPLGMDTESQRGGAPFCLTYSQQPGTGRLVRSSRTDLIRSLGSILSEWRGPVLFHNFLFDWGITDAMALPLPIHRIVDTMQRVFHLGNLPQGLKALATRELGMQMQDFEDLVKPYSRERVLTYYAAALGEDWPKPPERIFLDEKTGLWKTKKPQGMNTKLKRFHTDLRKYGENKDVFKSWENWEEDQPMIEERLGPWPGMCISHVPFEETLFYACRDADALIRLWPILKRMATRTRRSTQEHWRNG